MSDVTGPEPNRARATKLTVSVAVELAKLGSDWRYSDKSTTFDSS